jgi:hypothetical protein
VESAVLSIILVCSATIAVQNCSVDNATDVIHGPDANTPFDCAFSSQAIIAQTAIGPDLGRDQYLKILCVDRKHAAMIARLRPRDRLK